jgi:hypothetical protein
MCPKCGYGTIIDEYYWSNTCIVNKGVCNKTAVENKTAFSDSWLYFAGNVAAIVCVAVVVIQSIYNQRIDIIINGLY